MGDIDIPRMESLLAKIDDLMKESQKTPVGMFRGIPLETFCSWCQSNIVKGAEQGYLADLCDGCEHIWRDLRLATTSHLISGNYDSVAEALAKDSKDLPIVRNLEEDPLPVDWHIKRLQEHERALSERIADKLKQAPVDILEDFICKECKKPSGAKIDGKGLRLNGFWVEKAVFPCRQCARKVRHW